MGKLLSFLAGGIILLLGFILLMAWWYELLFVIRGILPLLLILGGAISLAAGISENRDRIRSVGKK